MQLRFAKRIICISLSNFSETTLFLFLLLSMAEIGMPYMARNIFLFTQVIASYTLGIRRAIIMSDLKNIQFSEEDLQDYLTDERDKIGYSYSKLREGMGLTQIDIAKKAGLSLRSITRIENGQDNYTIDNLNRALLGIGMGLQVVKVNSRSLISEELIYDSLIKFMIALPFISLESLYSVLRKISFDFSPHNLPYITGQIDYLIECACKNEHSKKIIDAAYSMYKNEGIDDAAYSNACSLLDEEYGSGRLFLDEKDHFSNRFMLDTMWKAYLQDKSENNTKENRELLSTFLK